MARRTVVCLVVGFLLAWAGGGTARAGDEPVFRGFETGRDDTVSAYALSVTSRATLKGEVIQLPAVSAEFRLSVHAPDDQGRRLAELVYTKLQVEPDSGGMADVANRVVNQTFRLVLDREGNLIEFKGPEGFPGMGFDLRQIVEGPLPRGLEKRELRVGERVSVPVRTVMKLEGVEMVTEGETTLEYAGREERDGAAQDVLLLTAESRSGLAAVPPGEPGGLSSAHYLTQVRGRLYADPVSRLLTGMVLETVVAPPTDAPGLPLVGTSVEVRLVSSGPLQD